MKYKWKWKWNVKVKTEISSDEIGNWQFSANCQQLSVTKVSVVDMTTCSSIQPFKERQLHGTVLSKIRSFQADVPVIRAVFHWTEFSPLNDIFFCLLTPTLCQLSLNKRKCRSARKIPPSGRWPKGHFSLNDFWHSDASLAWRSKTPTSFYPLKKARNSRDGNYSFEFCPLHAATHRNR